MTIRPKDRKLAELILFISERSEGDPAFGEEKLIRLLFNVDFSAFRIHKKSVTGQQYEKLFAGPAPKRLGAIRKALVERGELAVREREPFGSKQNRTFSLRLADLSEFNADEIALVTKLITQNWGRGSSDVRNISEEIWGWEKAEDREFIPYEIAFISRRPATAQEWQRALQDIPRARAILARQETVLTNA